MKIIIIYIYIYIHIYTYTLQVNPNQRSSNYANRNHAQQKCMMQNISGNVVNVQSVSAKVMAR